jgi:hypothetical protein
MFRTKKKTKLSSYELIVSPRQLRIYQKAIYAHALLWKSQTLYSINFRRPIYLQIIVCE